MLTTTLDKALNWARSNALWPATFGLACCAIEMMSIVTSRYDSARFGAEVFRASPRQADMLILSGRVSIKMAPVIRRIYDQMLEPKWVIAMGACASSAGVFNNYALVSRRRQVPAGGRPRPGLPAAARGADPRDPQAAAQGPGPSRPRLARRATRPRAPRSSPTRTSPHADLTGRLDAGRDRTGADRARAARAASRTRSPTPSTTAASRRWWSTRSRCSTCCAGCATSRTSSYRFLASLHGVRLPAGRAALRRPLRAAEHGPRRARAREGAAGRPGRAGAARDRLVRRAVPDRRIPGARGRTTCSASSSAATRTCAGS